MVRGGFGRLLGDEMSSTYRHLLRSIEGSHRAKHSPIECGFEVEPLTLEAAVNRLGKYITELEERLRSDGPGKKSHLRAENKSLKDEVYKLRGKVSRLEDEVYFRTHGESRRDFVERQSRLRQGLP